MSGKEVVTVPSGVGDSATVITPVVGVLLGGGHTVSPRVVWDVLRP